MRTSSTTDALPRPLPRVRLAATGVLAALLLIAPAGVARGLDEDDTATSRRADRRIAVFEHLAEDLLEQRRIEALAAVRGILEHLDSRENAPVRTLDGFDLLEPVDGRIGSGFGPRLHPILGVTRMHRGVDIGAVTGTPVRAAGPGHVLRSGPAGEYGILVVVEHGDGTETRYAHLSRTRVALGERVVRGQTIGEVGSTGLSTGPHLHFELRVDGEPIDPSPWLAGLRVR